MAQERQIRFTLLVAVVCLLVLAVAGPTAGQVIDDLEPTTTTTLPSSSTTTPSTTTTAPGSSTSTPPTDPGTTPTTAPGTTAPPVDPGDGDGGDGGDDGGPRIVPPDAQRIIDSVRRTAPNDTQALYDGVQELVELGIPIEEAIRVGFGRFPVAGVARYSHDWLFPRWGPGFRFHHGTDIVAPFGTPLRAVVDGTATSSSSALGGLSVKVHMDDGTYFYYAHLSALPEDFVSGMEVQTGDIVGFVGDSGNARGGVPHLHFGVYPDGGGPTDPKPILDGFIADALDQLPAIVEQVRASRQGTGAPASATGVRTPRSLLATSLLRPLTDRTAAGSVPTEVLYQASASPSGGLSVAESQAEQLAASIDWEAQATQTLAGQLLAAQLRALMATALGPLLA